MMKRLPNMIIQKAILAKQVQAKTVLTTKGAHSAKKLPEELVNTSSQNASKAGSYGGVHWMYAPGVLATIWPVLLGYTLVYGVTKFPVVLVDTLV